MVLLKKLTFAEVELIQNDIIAALREHLTDIDAMAVARIYAGILSGSYECLSFFCTNKKKVQGFIIGQPYFNFITSKKAYTILFVKAWHELGDTVYKEILTQLIAHIKELKCDTITGYVEEESIKNIVESLGFTTTFFCELQV